MTYHRMFYDLSPIPKILSLLNPGEDAVLRELVDDAKKKSLIILGPYIGEDNIHPSTKADLAELDAMTALSPDEIAAALSQATRELLEFLGIIRKYVTRVELLRKIGPRELALLPELAHLLGTLSQMFPKDS